MTMTRDEHLEWCKKRALKYLDEGGVQDAICSMLSDMRKHEETAGVNQSILALGLLIATREDPTQARLWIKGFR